MFVNAGGPATIDTQGTSWHADTGATSGNVFSNGSPIANAGPAAYVYQSERFSSSGQLTYTFTVPSRTPYRIILKFAELYFNAPGQRVFNVSINGVPVPALQNLDIFARVGQFAAFDYELPVVQPSTPQITIQLTGVNGGVPKINGIVILPSVGFTLPH